MPEAALLSPLVSAPRDCSLLATAAACTQNSSTGRPWLLQERGESREPFEEESCRGNMRAAGSLAGSSLVSKREEMPASSPEALDVGTEGSHLGFVSPRPFAHASITGQYGHSKGLQPPCHSSCMHTEVFNLKPLVSAPRDCNLLGAAAACMQNNSILRKRLNLKPLVSAPRECNLLATVNACIQNSSN